MSLACLEALGMGLPIVCTENSGISEYITNEKNGFIINVCSINEILEKIEWFINNKNKINKMKKEAKNTAKDLTWESYEKNIIASLKKIL